MSKSAAMKRKINQRVAQRRATAAKEREKATSRRPGRITADEVREFRRWCHGFNNLRSSIRCKLQVREEDVKRRIAILNQNHPKWGKILERRWTQMTLAFEKYDHAVDDLYRRLGAIDDLATNQERLAYLSTCYGALDRCSSTSAMVRAAMENLSSFNEEFAKQEENVNADETLDFALAPEVAEEMGKQNKEHPFDEEQVAADAAQATAQDPVNMPQIIQDIRQGAVEEAPAPTDEVFATAAQMSGLLANAVQAESDLKAISQAVKEEEEQSKQAEQVAAASDTVAESNHETITEETAGQSNPVFTIMGETETAVEDQSADQPTSAV